MLFAGDKLKSDKTCIHYINIIDKITGIDD